MVSKTFFLCFYFSLQWNDNLSWLFTSWMSNPNMAAHSFWLKLLSACGKVFSLLLRWMIMWAQSCFSLVELSQWHENNINNNIFLRIFPDISSQFVTRRCTAVLVTADCLATWGGCKYSCAPSLIYMQYVVAAAISFTGRVLHNGGSQ